MVAPEIALSRETDSVPLARHQVRALLGEDPVRYDVELVVTELVTNAVLHAPEGEIALRLRDLGEVVRVEVEDTGHGMPVAVRESTTAMTGRGLALVAALCRAWGVDSGRPGNKVIWAEVPRGAADLVRSEPEIDLEKLLAGWEDEDAEPRYEVRLGSVPTDLLLEAKAHVDNLVREFALATETELPAHLATLVPAVVEGFAEARVAIKEQALAAAARQEPETELVLHLHASAAEAGEDYLAALDELDRYANAARLLTLASPPVHQVFRHWYVQSLVDQLRRQARGEQLAPGLTFPARLAQEVGTLAGLRPSVRRYTGLYEVASALSGLTTAEQVAEAVVGSGMEILGAHAGGLLSYSEGRMQVLAATGYSRRYLDHLEASDIDAADLPGPVVLRTGEPLWVESAEQRDAHFPTLRDFEPRTIATCLVPLVAGRRLGVLRFSFDVPRLFDDSERRYVLALADQAAVALQRAELFLAEQRARQDAELLAARLDGLMNVVGQLTRASTEAEITGLAVRSATEQLGARSARVHLLDGTVLRGRASASEDPVLAQSYPAVDPTDPELPAHEALTTGQPVLLKDRADIAARYPRLRDLYTEDRSLLLAPLIVDDHRLGVLTVSFAPEQQPEKQLSFVTSLADATAQALERVAAGARASQAVDRLQFLAEASVALSGSLDVTETLRTVAQLVVPRMADWCSVSLADSDRFPVVAVAHTDPAKVAWAMQIQERYPSDPDAPTGAPAVARTGKSELYAEIPDALLVATAQDEEHLRLIREVGMTSALVVPLVGRDGPFGAITMIMSDSSRRFDADDVRDAEDLARRAALAVETVTAFAAQEGRLEAVSRVADAAQRAILPTPPSELGAVRLAARYVSATTDALVGGDLYEVVRRPGAVRLLIGDVRGKGLEAVRNATIVLGEFRAAAEDLDDVAQVARQLDRRLTGHLADEDFVTALIAEITDDGDYTLVACGHPPPLLVSATEIRPLEIRSSLPLGLGAEPSCTTGRLAPGDRMLLYTDGLIEARSADGDFADVDVVVAPLQRASDLGTGLDEVLAAVEAWTGAGLGDDLALLAVSLS